MKKAQTRTVNYSCHAGLLSNKNIQIIVEINYYYILGARIKNESKNVKTQILATKLKNNQSIVIDREDNSKLILNYKKTRALKRQGQPKKGT